MSNEYDPSLTNLCDSQGALTVGRLLQHLREPQNLITYLVLTAWMKFMGVAEHIPSITIG
jgi:hypothetical protein